MSSREFVVLVRKLPDDGSAFKAEAPKPFGRGGDWPEWVQMLAETHKENALYRASKYVGGPNEYVPQVFIPPAERAELARQMAEDELASMDLELLLSKAIDR